MLENVTIYGFSPTGGTRKVATIFAQALAKAQSWKTLDPTLAPETPATDVIIAAAPVYGGRIPQPCAKALAKLDGHGKKAIALAVFGNRDYDDALLEICDILEKDGFDVTGAGAFVAKHSLAPEVAKNRPDAQDASELEAFAKNILEKLANGSTAPLQVSGNRPYKEVNAMPVTPLSTDACKRCQACAKACPTGAISLKDDSIQTNKAACILCLSCVTACPNGARILPPDYAAQMAEKLAHLNDSRKENVFYL